MYTYVKGKLLFSSPLEIHVEVGGIGYKIHIPASMFGLLPPLQEAIEVHTSFIVRENSLALYGFLTTNERDLFEAVIGVNGIGPKLGLSIIGHLSPQQLQHAIHNNEIALLSKVPGIGKKTAERLIIELRDKLSSFLPRNPEEFTVKHQTAPRTLLINDAMSTLINLGYHQNIAQKAIKKTLEDAPEEIDLATLITKALKNV